MNKFYPNKEDERRERLIALYVTALDENNLDCVSSVLTAAQSDAELDRLINEVNADYERELEAIPFEQDAEIVRELLQQHLPSAFEPLPQRIEVLTFSDVAKQMDAKGKVLTTDQSANQQLLKIDNPLPAKVTLPEIKRVVANSSVAASEKFWRLFHETAVLLSMKQGHQQGLQAAREKNVQRKTAKAAQKVEEAFDGSDDETNN